MHLGRGCRVIEASVGPDKTWAGLSCEVGTPCLQGGEGEVISAYIKRLQRPNSISRKARAEHCSVERMLLQNPKPV